MFIVPLSDYQGGGILSFATHLAFRMLPRPNHLFTRLVIHISLSMWLCLPTQSTNHLSSIKFQGSGLVSAVSYLDLDRLAAPTMHNAHCTYHSDSSLSSRSPPIAYEAILGGAWPPFGNASLRVQSSINTIQPIPMIKEPLKWPIHCTNVHQTTYCCNAISSLSASSCQINALRMWLLFSTFCI